MKKFAFAIILFCILGISGNVYASPMGSIVATDSDGNTSNNTAMEVGGVLGRLSDNGNNVISTVYIGTSPCIDINLDTFFSGTAEVDSQDNVNRIFERFNEINDNSLPSVTTKTKYENDENDESSWYDARSFNLSLPPYTQYISLKWGSTNNAGAGWYLWYVGDVWSAGSDHNILFEDDGSAWFHFEGLSHGLSHYTIWDGDTSITQTPEPATFVLFGFGLIGAAMIGRKRKAHHT